MYKTMEERIDQMIKFTQGRCTVRMGLLDDAEIAQAKEVIAKHTNPWAKLVQPTLIDQPQLGRTNTTLAPEQVELEDVVVDEPIAQAPLTPPAKLQAPTELPAAPRVKMKWVLRAGKMTQVPA